MKSVVLALLFASTVAWADLPIQDAGPITQPSVGRTVLICDQWQWIGNGATTWGCLTTPRRAIVAGGQVTDEVVTSLQNQINELKAQIESFRASPR